MQPRKRMKGNIMTERKGNPYKKNNGRFGSKDDHDYVIYEPNKDRQISANKEEARQRNSQNVNLTQVDIKVINDEWVNGDHHFVSKNPQSEQSQRLEAVIDKLPAYKGFIYRGSEENPIRHNYKIGDEFSFGHIGAWSKNEAIAQIHASKHISPIIYRVKNGTYGKDISPFVEGDKKAESEVLTGKQAKYVISGKSKKKMLNLEGDEYIVVSIIDLKERR